MNITEKLTLSMIGFFVVTNTFADQGLYVYEQSDHIYYYSKTQNKDLQLTYLGIDHDPVLSPDGRWIAFVRRSKHIIPKECAFSTTSTNYADQVWIYDLTTMKQRLLVAANYSCDQPMKQIVDPNHLKFSPNSKTLYFETSAWATSGAIHAVDVDGKNLRFVTDGNDYHVVMDGPYKGNLITNQHRYRFKGDTPQGSYDWDWLYTPDGKKVKLYKKEN